MTTYNHSIILSTIIFLTIYRTAISILLEATYSITPLQKRILLEENAIADPLLTKLLSKPYSLNLSVSLCHKLLFIIIIILFILQQSIANGKLFLIVAITNYMLILDYALPNIITAGNYTTWIIRLFPIYRNIYHILQPIVDILAFFIEKKLENKETTREDRHEENTEDCVTALIKEGEAEGILETKDRELIRSVVEFGDTLVREVMIPRTLIQSISVYATTEEAWIAFRNGRHSRMPVYQDTVDNIIGILLLKDLMQLPTVNNIQLKQLLKPVCFVPESKYILSLLRELQRTGAQLAIVVDEYGSLSGLVSMEDLLEEVFGDIRDEHESQSDIQEISNREFLVCGHIHIEDLEDKIGFECQHNGFDTLSGLIMTTLGHVPTIQESLEISGMKFTVKKMEGMRIIQVHIKKITE